MNVYDMTTFKEIERPRYMNTNRFAKLYVKLCYSKEEYWNIQWRKLKSL